MASMSHEMLAEVVFAGFMAVVVGALVLNLLVALYRERRASRESRDAAADGPSPE